MKVSCLQENLVKGLGIVGKSVGNGASLPVLANILLEAKAGGLNLAANNLETAAACLVGAKVEVEGAITVPARLFTDLVSAFPPERVDLTLNETSQTLNIRCAHFEANVKGIDAGDFPAMSMVMPGAEIIALDPVALKQAIGQMVVAAAAEDTRPILTGVRVVFEGGLLTLESSDGFRLARKTLVLPAPLNGTIEAVIPARALAELGRLLGGQTEPVRVSFDHARVVFKVGDICLACQLLEGKFPKLDQIIPQTHRTSTEVDTKDLLKAVRVSNLFARDAANILRLAAVPGEERLVLNAASAETGDNTAYVDAAVTGEPIEIAFNARYLADALAVLGSERAILETTEPARPGLVKPAGDDSFFYVLMPMHLGR